MIDLYYWPTPNGWKISIMLEECGLPYKLVPVNIGTGDQFKPDFLKISPNNRMPAIVDPEPPDPIPPNPSRPYHTETRTYACTGDTLLALTSGGAKYGAGASDSLPIGAWSGWTYRAALKFAAIPWGTVGAAGEVRAVKAARLNVRTTSQIRVGFGSSPKTT